MKLPLRLAVGLLLSALSFYAFYSLNKRQGQIPPLGRLVSPFVGFWQNAESTSASTLPEMRNVQGLFREVRVRIDTSFVTHIEAENEHDLFFAQGYLTAANRLWQMDFVTRAASGRISEVVGPLATDYDKYQRRIGMVYGAKQSLSAMMADKETEAIIKAYTDGVNAYLQYLSPVEYPLEFKILDYKPEPWTHLKTALLLKYMAYSLTGYSDDYKMTQLLAKLGKADLNLLFPDYEPMDSPVIPRGTRFATNKLAQAIDRVSQPTFTSETESIPSSDEDPGNGSNNWALSARRSTSGNALLANDPHLNLTLPSIWMQVQLTCPTLNVTGVSIPGAPAVIIGYNDRVAWGVTSADADVWDHYQIHFTNKERTQYEFGGQNKEVRMQLDTIWVRGQKSIQIKTPYTVHGPVVVAPGENFNLAGLPADVAVRWMAHRPSNELLAFYKLNKARNLSDYRKALLTHECPAQNVIFADRQGNIALTANGKFAIKSNLQGKFVLDGSKPEQVWNDFVPNNEVPSAVNPPQGYLSSANQQSADSTYPHYLNWEYASPDRALVINNTLGKIPSHTLASAAGLQNNNFGQLASMALPKMLSLTQANNLRPEVREALEMCRQWDYQYDSAQVGPSIFEEWWRQFNDTLWDEMQGLRHPTRFTTLRVLTEGKAPAYVDNRNTNGIEDLQTLVTASFKEAYQHLMQKHGAAGKQWNWGRVKHTTIQHLAKIPGLGVPFISCNGAKNVVNATDTDNGPSWRMVVEMSKKPKGYGIIPGGQSGNPGSPNYSRGVEKWRLGQLDALISYDYQASTYPGLREMIILTP